MTHAVATCELNRLVDGQFIIHADKTVDPTEVSMKPFSELEMTDIRFSLCAGAVGVRGVGLVKRFAKIPPVLLRAMSLPECVLEMAGGEVGCLIVLVRRIVGRVDIYGLLGSRADMLLRVVSVCQLLTISTILPVKLRNLNSAHRGRAGT